MHRPNRGAHAAAGENRAQARSAETSRQSVCPRRASSAAGSSWSSWLRARSTPRLAPVIPRKNAMLFLADTLRLMIDTLCEVHDAALEA